MDNRELGIRKIETSDEISYLPLGSVIKVIWHKSDCYEEGEEYFGVKYGANIGWEDGHSDEIETLIVGMKNNCCEVYLTDDKVLALEHLYQVCMKNIEDIESNSIDKMSGMSGMSAMSAMSAKSYGCILAFTELEHKIHELLYPEMY